MKVQELYEFREEWEFCSGTELHKFLLEEMGEPSPSGDGWLDDYQAGVFVLSCLDRMKANSPSLAAHADAAREAWFA